MHVDRRQLLDDGYIVLRQVIPPEQLESLRASFEVLVERQKAIWTRERKPDAPPGGVWETDAQPLLVFQTLVDSETADAAEFSLHENTLGTSRRLMGVPETAVVFMFLRCNPVRDHGPGDWHRDTNPGYPPLEGLQTDMLANGPGFLQWNIALYDDDVLGVVPRSHFRLNTPEEDRVLLEDPSAPLPGGIRVELGPGDGVVYINTMLHRTSDHSATLRRAIQLGYRSFGGAIFPYLWRFYWDLDFTCHLSPEGRASFERYSELATREGDRVETAFRAMLDRDGERFGTELEALHSGEVGRMVCVALLSKMAHRICGLKDPGVAGLPRPERADAIGSRLHCLGHYEALAARFSAPEAEAICGRFAALEARLQLDAEQVVMPEDFEIEDFIATWK